MDGKQAMPKIVVFSDYICPFCFIGKSRIDRLRKEFQLDVEWRNMEIHPETPLDGIPSVRLDSKFYNQLWLNVERLAEESGVEIRLPLILSNSNLALIASEYAKQEGKFEAFHDAVFRAYWQQGENIGDLKVLSMITEKVGLNSFGLKRYIREGNWEDCIERNRRTALRHNASGVPTFVIGKQEVVGAQPYEAIRTVLLKEWRSSRDRQIGNTSAGEHA